MHVACFRNCQIALSKLASTREKNEQMRYNATCEQLGRCSSTTEGEARRFGITNRAVYTRFHPVPPKAAPLINTASYGLIPPITTFKSRAGPNVDVLIGGGVRGLP